MVGVNERIPRAGALMLEAVAAVAIVSTALATVVPVFAHVNAVRRRTAQRVYAMEELRSVIAEGRAADEFPVDVRGEAEPLLPGGRIYVADVPLEDPGGVRRTYTIRFAGDRSESLTTWLWEANR